MKNIVFIRNSHPRRWNLVMRLIVALTALSLISITLVTFTFSIITYREVAHIINNQLDVVSNLQGAQIGHVLDEQVNLLRSNILNSPIIVSTLREKFDEEITQSELIEKDILWQSDIDFPERLALITTVLENPISDQLNTFINAFPDHAELFLTDKHGALVASTNQTSDYFQADESWWQHNWNNGNGALLLNSTKFDESTNILAIEISFPIVDEATSEVIGIAKSIYNISAIVNEIQAFRLGSTGRTRIIDAENRFIAHENLNKIGTPIPQQWLAIMDDAVMNQTIAEVTGDDGKKLVIDSATVTTQGNITEIDDLNWKVLVEQEHSEAFLLISQLQIFMLLSALIIAAIALGLAFFFGQALTRKLTDLISTARHLTRGEYTMRANITSQDEFGELGQSFNTMADELARTIENLNAQVKETERVNLLLSTRNRYLTELTRIIEILMDQTQSSALFHSIVNSAAEFVHAPHAEILFLEGNEYVVTASTNNPIHTLGNRIEPNQGILAWNVHNSLQVVSYDNYSSMENRLELYSEYGLQAVAGFPILIANQCIGVLAVGRYEPDYPFTPEQLDYCEQLTNLIALLIHHVNLHESANREIEQRKQIEIALRESEARFRSYFELNIVGLAITSPDRGWLEVNTRICEMFGYTRQELMQTTWAQLTHPDDIQKNDTVFERLLSGEIDNYSLQKRYIHKSGQIVHAEIDVGCVRNEDGSLKYLVTVIEDITEIKNAEKAKFESERLTNLLHAEQEWSATVQRTMKVFSHEMRIPLAVIQTSSDVLSHYSEKLTHERKLEKFNIIQEQVKKIQQILDDVVDIVQNSLNHQTFNPEIMDLERFCYVLIGELKSTIGKDHDLKLISDGNNTQVFADAKLLTRMLMNLLSNAIKYSPQNTEIILELQQVNNTVQISVTDHGMGISEQHLTRIFEPFYRTDNVGSIQGTGLGLNIVKDCVKLHQGEITVESQVGVGTTFTISLSQQPDRNCTAMPE